MFKNKKLYKIEYKVFHSRYNTIIEAKDEFQALKKFKREVKDRITGFSIISLEEIQPDYFSDSVSKKTAKEIFDLIKDYPTPTLDDDNSIYYTAFNHALECIKIEINNNL